MDKDVMTTIFKVEVIKDKTEIERGGPSGNEDWYSLTVGWAIGKGMKPEEAHEFAQHIRYNVDF